MKKWVLNVFWPRPRGLVSLAISGLLLLVGSHAVFAAGATGAVGGTVENPLVTLTSEEDGAPSKGSAENPFHRPEQGEGARLLVSGSLPQYSGQAIADFILTARQSFVEFAGSGEARMSQAQFDRLAAAGRLPSKESSGAYFSAHDKDHDGTLTIAEFTPSVAEVLKEFSLKTLTQAYISGTPYPNGVTPLGSPFAPQANLPAHPPLYLSVTELENRITRFSNAMGATTKRDAQGRLEVYDQEGRRVPLPPGLIPLPKTEAEKGLRRFAESMGGSFSVGEGGLPMVRNAAGKDLGPMQWPPALRPPYLPPRNGE